MADWRAARPLHGRYQRFVHALCRLSVRHPWRWVLLTAILCLPALAAVRHLDVDTDLIRLLPRTSSASVLTKKLNDVISDGGYFVVMFESDDRQKLLAALEDAGDQVAALEGVESVQYRWPADFVEKFRYLLIPNDYLELVYEEVLGWEAEINPFVDDLAGPSEEDEELSWGEKEDREDLELVMYRYLELPEYHESDDGRVMGMFVRTRKGVTNLGAIHDLFGGLNRIADAVGEKYGVWTGVGGSHRNKIDEYALITSDLSRTGTVAAVLIVLLLLLSFRSPVVVAVILYPLFVGLLWAFSLVPATVGDLNLITAFLLVIMFGMGVDYSIHLVKRFRMELSKQGVEEALCVTYLSTGASVIVSGLTTALALSVLAVSDFRGFSEFGIVGALSIVMMLLAMFVSLPSALVLARRYRLVTAAGETGFGALMPRRGLTLFLVALVVLAAVIAARWLSFDYQLSNLSFDKSRIKGFQEVRDRQKKVYATSISPGALYLADDIEAVDSLVRMLEEAKAGGETIIGRVRSIRSFAPGEEEVAGRRELLADIQDTLAGRWTRKIEDPDRRDLVDDFRQWAIPAKSPALDELPLSLKRSYQANDGSGRHIVTVHPAANRKNGRNAMAFARALYEVGVPEGVQGPIGETVVFAEILWIVTGEGMWLALLTFGGVFLIVLVYRRSVKDTLWICLPLAAGVILALGIMTVAGRQLNFFNVVVIPALLGMGVDGGVHYYRRWRELGEDIPCTQRELFDPLSIANWTTLIGYAGMVFAHHPGIRSIGTFACIGLACIWVTTLFLFPGLLSFAARGKPAR